MKIGAIIQARVSSTRLPRKILKDLPYDSGITVLQHVIRRLKTSEKIDNIVVATTIGKNDKEIVNIAKKEGIKFFRGSEQDVLSRYYLAAKENNFDIIVRITSDCPCIDPELVDTLIEKHIKEKADYTSNSLKRTYPHGLDTEVLNFDALEKAYKNSQNDYEREHVTLYIYQNPNIFKIIAVEAPRQLYAPDIRVTLDTEEDYALLCAVFDYLYFKNKYFKARDLINLFKAKPWLKSINKKVAQKKILHTLEDELEEAVKILDLQDLKRARDFIKRHLPK